MSLVLSIDVGTSNMKAAVINDTGSILSHNTCPVEIHRPTTRAAEHNPEELLKSLISLCGKTLQGYRNDVSRICISAYQFGLILLDAEKRPLTGMTTLRDTRARITIDKFKEIFDGRDLYERTGCPPFMQYPLARIFYWQQHEPQLLDQAKWLLSGKAYFLYLLTGELISDPSTESASQMLSLQQPNWDQSILDKANISTEQLPKIVHSYKEDFPLKSDLRKTLGLNENVKVVPGVYDGAALAVGIGIHGAKTGVINIGTSGMFRIASDKPILDKNEDMRLQTYHFDDNRYLTGGAINNASLTLSWIRKQVLDVEYDELLELATSAPRCSKKLLFLPYLTGERDWKIGNYSSGVLFGMRDFHNKSDMARSFFEGVCYSLNLLGNALKDNSLNFNEIRVGGGGSKFDFWVQMLADVLDCPLKRSTSKASTLLGNAMLAYINAGNFSSFQEADENLGRPLQEFTPNKKANSEYMEMFEFYQSLYYSLSEHYQKLALMGH